MKSIDLKRGALAASISIAVLTAPTPLLAQWTGGIEGGTVFRDGGNATRLRLKVLNPARPFSHYLYADWIRGGSGENSYEAGYLPRYWFDNNRYVFGEATVLVDNPLSIDSQRQFALGAGYQLTPLKNQRLWVEAGFGLQQTEFLNETESDDSFGLVRAGFHQTLSNLFRLELDFDHVDGDELSQTTAEASIAFRIPSGSIKYSYRTRRISPDNAETIEDSDSFVSFSYGF